MMRPRRDYDYLFKIILVGDSDVGKSSLLLRFADDTFSESYISTIGVDFRFKTLTIDGKAVKLQIWDTAGQERFRTITSAYYRGAAGVMLVFDKANRESFDRIPDWLKEINKHSKSSTRVIVANKSESGVVQVSEETGKKFAEKNNMQYIETSAKSGEQVSVAFEIMARELINSQNKESSSQNKGNKLVVQKAQRRAVCCQKQ